MSDRPDDSIERLFREWVAAFGRGEADPDPFMAGLDQAGRDRLGTMIDRYLESDAAAVAPGADPMTARVDELVDAILPRLDGRAGALSDLLVQLRSERQLSRVEVVAALADQLAADPGETEKIDAYYHDLEWGSLPAAGLADRLLDVLATILGSSRDRLRQAGRALGPGRSGAAGPVFARGIDPVEDLPELGMASPGMASPGAGPVRATGHPDRIDELFTGG